VLYVTCEQFTNDLIEALRNKTTNEFRDKYRKIDVLLLDDVQFLSGKDSVQEEFFHTFNTLVTDKKQIVMCSDRQPSEINKLTDRIVSRMKSGMIADVKPPDIVTRTAILADKANSMGISIQRDILEMIANKFQSNIREMEGLLNRVVAYAKFSNKEITMELAEDAIRDIINSDKPKITVEYIQEKVAEYYSTTVEELCSKRRTKPLATYRQIAMYLCRKLLDNPLQEIGNKFGGKDHSTVMHSCDKIAQLIETDEEIAQHIVNIEKRIK
jgi:chromosomal replication initiator protein